MTTPNGFYSVRLSAQHWDAVVSAILYTLARAEISNNEAPSFITKAARAFYRRRLREALDTIRAALPDDPNTGAQE